MVLWQVTWTNSNVACLLLTKVGGALGALVRRLLNDPPGLVPAAISTGLAACWPGAPGGDLTVHNQAWRIKTLVGATASQGQVYIDARSKPWRSQTSKTKYLSGMNRHCFFHLFRRRSSCQCHHTCLRSPQGTQLSSCCSRPPGRSGAVGCCCRNTFGPTPARRISTSGSCTSSCSTLESCPGSGQNWLEAADEWVGRWHTDHST